MFNGIFFLLLVFLIRASFSKDDEQPVSNKMNITILNLCQCVLWVLFFGLRWCQQVIYVHSMGLQLKSTFVPPATFLLSPVLQVKTQAFQLLHWCLSYCSFSELKSDSKISALNRKSIQLLDNKSDSFHSGRVLKL